MSSGVGAAFLGAMQASISVLLTIFYGVLAAQFGLMSSTTTKEVSQLCVKVFLPALLITSVGSELHLDTWARYLPILIYAIGYNAISIALGMAMTKALKLPSWATPAVAFNNTTSLPLLLVQALESTGLLRSLLIDSSDSTSAAVSRAKSYFLVNSMVSNALTFAVGPQLLNAYAEDVPRDESKAGDCGSGDQDDGGAGSASSGSDDGEGGATEESSLLPAAVVRRGRHAASRATKRGDAAYGRLPRPAQAVLTALRPFLNGPLIGALVGGVLGLVPALHRAFFADSFSGGVFKAWLTTSVSNIGDLFAALQVIVVGVKLAHALRAMKAGDDSGTVPWRALAFVSLTRFVVWPAVSIAAVWGLAKRTDLLGDDPILWFAMMLMPTGPPALKLTALAEVTGQDEAGKMGIAKFLTMSYVISPLVAISVVGSLKASQDVMAR